MLTSYFYVQLSLMLISGVEALSQASFGEGTGRIKLSNVQCNGNERSLVNCLANSSGVNPCTHAQDAGVRCQSGSWIDKVVLLLEN